MCEARSGRGCCRTSGREVARADCSRVLGDETLTYSASRRTSSARHTPAVPERAGRLVPTVPVRRTDGGQLLADQRPVRDGANARETGAPTRMPARNDARQRRDVRALLAEIDRNARKSGDRRSQVAPRSCDRTPVRQRQRLAIMGGCALGLQGSACSSRWRLSRPRRRSLVSNPTTHYAVTAIDRPAQAVRRCARCRTRSGASVAAIWLVYRLGCTALRYLASRPNRRARGHHCRGRAADPRRRHHPRPSDSVLVVAAAG